MEAVELTEKKCKPCEAGKSPLTREEISTFMEGVYYKWLVNNDKKIQREFEFKDFRENIEFVNRVAKLAEEEGHHPDFCVSYNKLEVSLSTHAIGGLSENDFIMAAKINDLV